MDDAFFSNSMQAIFIGDGSNNGTECPTEPHVGSKIGGLMWSNFEVRRALFFFCFGACARAGRRCRLRGVLAPTPSSLTLAAPSTPPPVLPAGQIMVHEMFHAVTFKTAGLV